MNANAQLDGAERRQVVSPYDGYLQSAAIRAGQAVKQGDLLASLDDRDLVLEKLRWDTERQQHQLEYDPGARRRASRPRSTPPAAALPRPMRRSS